MIYNEALRYLESLQMHKIKLGLGAMQSFLEKVGRPENSLKFVHIAGTNGKGSVCATIADILRRSGYRIGVYTSPHFTSVRERFKVGNEYISGNSFARLTTTICEVLGEQRITYFEFTTALGFLWFLESKVDLVLLETGLGGRLDATNVVNPVISVITGVSMDHEAYLGNSLGEIAAEKAGIIKPNVPVVSGAIDPEAAVVIEKVSREKDTILYRLRKDFDYVERPDATWDWIGLRAFAGKRIAGLRCSCFSFCQRENDSLSLAVLQLLQDKGFLISKGYIRQGIAEVKWPGRMEYFMRDCVPAHDRSPATNGSRTLRYLLDGAHNPEGVENLLQSLNHNFRYRKLIVIWATMADKDVLTSLSLIVSIADKLIITQPDGERSAVPENIYALLPKKHKKKSSCIKRVDWALTKAQSYAEEEDLIVVAGSLYLVGAIRHILLGDLAQ